MAGRRIGVSFSFYRAGTTARLVQTVAMTRSPREDADMIATLSAVLDAHREQLACLSGVVGTGIGLASSHRAGEPRIVIQIFVSPASDIAPLRQTVRQIVGPHPVECVEMSLPRGETGGTESEG